MTKICVVGDVMLDRYWQGGASRLSPEGPHPVVNVSSVVDKLGGAANVALNTTALGCPTILVGQCGHDEAGLKLRNMCQSSSIDARLVTTESPTTLKLRVVSDGQALLRCDFEEKYSHHDLLAQFEKAVESVDAVIISDYGKGVLEQTEAFIALAKAAGKLVFVDPKRALHHYKGATVITPNEKEFRADVGAWKSDEELVQKAHDAVKRLDIKALLVTRSAKGMLLVQADGAVHHIPTQAKEVFDICGAGDTVIAAFARFVASGDSMLIAAIKANKAAGITVGHLGTSAVTLEELDSTGKIFAWEHAASIVTKQKEKGQKIVFTNGCFDILHPGHLKVLQQARSFGNKLVVGLNSDASVRRLKGPSRPINSETHRAQMLAALADVDMVVIFSQDTPLELIKILQPDVLVKGGDYDPSTVVGAQETIERGGKVEIIPLVTGLSTTNTIEKIKQEGLV